MEELIFHEKPVILCAKQTFYWQYRLHLNENKVFKIHLVYIFSKNSVTFQ